MTAAAVADPAAREFLRNADPVLARVIEAHPDFHPRAWIDELPGLDAFGTLIFQVAGQQLSVRATRAILSRLEEHFGGHLPSPAQLLAADPQALRASGLSTRKGATLRALAERFVDGRLSDDAFSHMTDEDIEVALTEVSGIGPWTAHGFLIFALDRPDVLLPGELGLRHAFSGCMGSTISLPNARWTKLPSGGGPTAASRSATCLPPSSSSHDDRARHHRRRPPRSGDGSRRAARRPHELNCRIVASHVQEVDCHEGCTHWGNGIHRISRHDRAAQDWPWRDGAGPRRSAG